MDKLLTLVFGGGRNVVVETAEVFRANAEASAVRAHDMQTAALAQFGAEFRLVRRGGFDRLMDALNRVPRPAMALGTIGLFASAMVDPVWFSERMAGIALVPEPLWWLLGAIVSFYFGARHQAKGQAFQREIAATMAAVPHVVSELRDIGSLRELPVAAVDVTDPPEVDASDNPALADWQRTRGIR